MPQLMRPVGISVHATDESTDVVAGVGADVGPDVGPDNGAGFGAAMVGCGAWICPPGT